jgi:F420-dependent oxidoreductase-like protein
MHLGLHLSKFDNPSGAAAIAAEQADIAAVTEAAGITWLSVMDHYFQMEHNGGAEDVMLEAYTTLGFFAAHTSTVRLGVLATGVTYRHPGLLAKIVTTLDVLSGGRAELGIGAAWYEREHNGLGVAFPPLAERFERLDEALRIVLQMWDPQNNGPFQGKHYQLDETLCVPQPVSAPRPPIMIAGGGEQKTLRLVAKYGDACNLFSTSPELVGRKFDILRRHCDEVGSDYDEISKTVLYNRSLLREGDVDGFMTEIAEYAKLGADTAIVMPPTGTGAAWIEKYCTPVVTRLASL